MAAGKGKGLIRSRTRIGSRSGKAHAAEARRGRPSEGATCQHCGSEFRGRVWHRARALRALPARVRWTTCPACAQVAASEYLGRVLVLGDLDTRQQAALERRLANVTARAAHTQPQRRLVSLERRGAEVEILTTSQKLAHRIAREVVKLLGGDARYTWSDDGLLLARCTPPAPRRPSRGR